ncbi:hypothetical protein NDU88_001488 [Pleurodeles waltl]|uniref:Uncharacterized protein n=1 Tax=Pleurodeles waltl TaxID=8319 RepID=A0AAV7SBS1_PLEWA|nr:hypothetical protein NDU88_001488 [Pleurodeles waltl]
MTISHEIGLDNKSETELLDLIGTWSSSTSFRVVRWTRSDLQNCKASSKKEIALAVSNVAVSNSQLFDTEFEATVGTLYHHGHAVIGEKENYGSVNPKCVL